MSYLESIPGIEERKEFATRIYERSQHFIQCRLWEGVSLQDFKGWYRMFRGDQERFLAAYLLDSLIYRSEAQSIASIQQLLLRIVPSALSPFLEKDCKLASVGSLGVLSALKARDAPSRIPIRFVVVRPPGDGPTESAYEVARLIKRYFRVNERLFIEADAIPQASLDGVRFFLLIDDFMGTGKQFSSFAKEVLDGESRQTAFCYAPLTAHERGVARIRQDHPYISVTPIEILRYHQSAFPHSALDQEPQPGEQELFDIYRRITERLGLPYPMGFGNMALSYAAHIGTPNDSLSIYWCSDRAFQPLFCR